MAKSAEKITVTKRVAELEAPIRKISAMAYELEKKGKKIYYLNIGDPGAYDFRLPARLSRGLGKAKKYNAYSKSEGDPKLLEAISNWLNGRYGLRLKPSDVIATYGVSEAVDFLMKLFVDIGDEVLLPDPGFPQYNDLVMLSHGKPVGYKCDKENGWQPDVDDIRKKVSDKTRFITLINPNNPTGAVYEREVVKKVIDIAGENNLFVVSDEIYNQLIFSGKEHASALPLSKDVPIIGLDGISKSHNATGWRLGFMVVHDPGGRFEKKALEEHVKKPARERLSACTPIMKAAIPAFVGPQTHLENLNKKLKKRAEFAYKRLNEIPGISAQKTDAAFYSFADISELVGDGKPWPNDEAFVHGLLNKKGVAVVHGSAFGKEYGKGHIRVVVLPQIRKQAEAFDLIEEYVRENRIR